MSSKDTTTTQSNKSPPGAASTGPKEEEDQQEYQNYSTAPTISQSYNHIVNLLSKIHSTLPFTYKKSENFQSLRSAIHKLSKSNWNRGSIPADLLTIPLGIQEECESLLALIGEGKDDNEKSLRVELLNIISINDAVSAQWQDAQIQHPDDRMLGGSSNTPGRGYGGSGGHVGAPTGGIMDRSSKKQYSSSGKIPRKRRSSGGGKLKQRRLHSKLPLEMEGQRDAEDKNETMTDADNLTTSSSKRSLSCRRGARDDDDDDDDDDDLDGDNNITENKDIESTATTTISRNKDNDTTPKSSSNSPPKPTIDDPFPTRQYTPLLTLPPYPTNPTNPNANTESIPHGAELWPLTEIYFPEANTYPLDYYRRLLGLPNPPTKSTSRNVYLSSLSTPPSSSSDPFLQPPASSFPSSFRRQNGDDRLDYHDPVWKTLCDDYRGFDKSAMKPAEKLSLNREISKEVLAMARETGVYIPPEDEEEKSSVGDEATSDGEWYYATMNDIETLEKFDTRGYWNDRSDIVAALKCTAQFILLSSKSFVHYGFYWYKLPPSGGLPPAAGLPPNITTNAPSELIFVVFHLSGALDERALLLLTLAMEHARECSVSYGVTEKTENKLCRFYKRCFRMTEGKGGCLVLDFKKVNYKFALWKFGETDENEEEKGEGMQQRLIVQMPLKELVNRQQNDYTKSESQDDDGLPAKMISKTRFFSSVEEERRHLTTGIRFHGGKNTITPLDSDVPIDTSRLKFDQWRLLKSFPLPSLPPSSKNDTLGRHISTLQKKLTSLEGSLYPTALTLFQKLIDHNHHQLSLLPTLSSHKETLIQYEQVIRLRREAHLAWQAQLEQDMDAVCDICGDGDVTPENQILFCEACNVAVHQKCYQIERVPEGDYFCKACLYFNRDKKGKIESTDDKKESTALCQPCDPPEQQTKQASKPLDIVCELCPRQQGAFVRVYRHPPPRHPRRKKSQGLDNPPPPNWVHVVCAKWMGLVYIPPDPVQNISSFSMIEPVKDLKKQFKALNQSCMLCQSSRGAMNKCRDCDSYLHVTCARAVGTCRVVHGESHKGTVEGDDAWTLTCPKHSKKILKEEVEEEGGANNNNPVVSVEQLVMAAQSLPPDDDESEEEEETWSPFGQMMGDEREEFLGDVAEEEGFLKKLMLRLEGRRCMVCDAIDNNEMKKEAVVGDSDDEEEDDDDDENLKAMGVDKLYNSLTKCKHCHAVFHMECYHSVSDANINDSPAVTTPGVNNNNALPTSTSSPQKPNEFVCDSCQYKDEMLQAASDFEEPNCHMCNMKGGALLKAYATPASKKSWNKNPKGFLKSLFGKQIWCHAICGMWHPHCIYKNGNDPTKPYHFDCTGVIMANGHRHVNETWACALCQLHTKVKLACVHKSCINEADPKRTPHKFHLSCARQAGLEVADNDGVDVSVDFHLKCFEHVRSDYVFRARLEDLIELEKLRSGLEFENANLPMSISHAAKLFNMSVVILQVLGWAWRWAEWWVAKGDNWEPFLDEGQVEEDMTPEELRVVESTAESRCKDARRCRLAAFGAALRNREFDRVEGDDIVAFDRAVRAVLSTPSLVGPLKQFEIDFFAQWLGRAYRSKHPLLGFGDDQIPVANYGRCVHIEDGSPKYQLDHRPLPGKTPPKDGGIFEDRVDELDDFLKPLVLDDEHPYKGDVSFGSHSKSARRKRSRKDEAAFDLAPQPQHEEKSSGRPTIDDTESPSSPTPAAAAASASPVESEQTLTPPKKKHSSSSTSGGGKSSSSSGRKRKNKKKGSSKDSKKKSSSDSGGGHHQRHLSDYEDSDTYEALVRSTSTRRRRGSSKRLHYEG